MRDYYIEHIYNVIVNSLLFMAPSLVRADRQT